MKIRSPNAIIGVACRLPASIRSIDGLARALDGSTEALQSPPPSRSGSWNTRGFPPRFGFISDAILTGFPFERFGLSQAEAQTLDPTQRLILQLVWEAIEDGRRSLEAIRGSRTGIYLGLGPSDWAHQALGPSASPSAHSGTGAWSSVAAGRVAYLLGITGPTLSVDTACSSGLTAAHLALRDLKAGTIDRAVVASANLLLDASSTRTLMTIGALSPSGHCRPFDHRADGYVRSEGGVALLLEHERVHSTHTRVHGWLAGSAINHDGPSNGLTAPSARAQQDVLRAALEEAEWAPSSVDILEAHGTGTPLGDPIEWSAIRAVYGEGESPCFVGSLKGTHGHLEAASGLAGVLRVLATFRQGRTFPQPWIEEINPRIQMEGTRLQLSREGQSRRIERAGVSAFGLSGTNVHALLQAPQDGHTGAQAHRGAEASPIVIGLSGPTSASVRDQVRHWREHAGNWSTSQLGARAQIKPQGLHRVAGVLDSGSSAVMWLTQAETAPIQKALPRLRIGFAYTGQAAQVAGMALPLMKQEPIFRNAMEQVGDAYRNLTGRALVEVLEQQALLDHTSFTQPALFAVEWSLTRLLEAWNLHPSLVLGHSVGEIAAACAAGVFTMEQAMDLAVARGRALGDLPEGGAMAAIEATPQELLPSLPDDVVIAGMNGPRNTTLSGGSSSIDRVVEHWSRADRMAHKLPVSHAFHSPRMAPASDALRRALERVQPTPPSLPWYSTLTGKKATAAAASSAYWGEQLLRPVRFQDAVLAAQSQVDVFVELGPKPVLTSLARSFSDRPWLGTLHATGDEVRSLRETVAQLWSLGAPIDRTSWGSSVAPADLPPEPIKGGELPLHPSSDEPAPAAKTDTPYIMMRWDPAPNMPRVEGGWTDRDDPVCAKLLEGAELAQQGSPPRHLLIRPGGEAPDACLEVQSALAQAQREGLTLWVITSGMQSECPSESSGALWALAACLEAEHPRTWGGILDVNSIEDPQIAFALGRAPRAYLDPSGLRVPRLSIADHRSAPPVSPLGRVLVLGGTGSIGQSVVQWAQEQGADEVHIAARRLPDDPIGTECAQHHACDVADPASLASLLRELHEGEPLDVVIHAAGQAHRSTTMETPPELWHDAWEPRSVCLNTLEAELDAKTRVILTGSVVTLLGGERLAPYAAACGAFEARVHRAQSRGLPWSLLRLGPWQGGGVIPQSELQSLAQTGQRLVQPSDLHDALSRTIQEPATRTICPAEWGQLGRVLQARRPRPFLRELTPPGSAQAATHPTEPIEAVQQVVHALLGRLPEPNEGFFEAGFDSLLAVELARRLEVRLGRSIPVAHVFDHPSLEALSRFLVREEGEESRVIAPTSPGAQDDPLVVCAMACRFPGAASPEQYAETLESGTCHVRPVPAERFHDPHRQAGFIDGIERFDPDAFGLAHREALAIDPQQRMLLEMARETLDRAGPLRIPETLVGVYIGIGHSEYWRRLQPTNDPDTPHPSYPWSGTGNASSFAAGRLAHVLGLQGPALAVDTACSSSLVALHLAIRALRSGECAAALVGGANALLDPESFTYLESVGALSQSGVCHVFDRDADGYVRGEGCGMILVARQSEAERQRWPVLARILGSSIAHDGPASGLTVPNGIAQERVIRNALTDAGCQPEDVDYVETHGTGTALGDPIELAALARVHSQRTRTLHIGSVKPSIGHLEAASGIASVIKVILALERGRIPATLHHQRPTPHWPDGFDASVITETAAWEGTRIAGVSSFGLSGTNAHVLLQSGEDLSRDPAEEGAASFEAASAPSRDRLDLWWSTLRSSGLNPSEKGACLARFAAERFRRVQVGARIIEGEVAEQPPSVGVLVDLTSSDPAPSSKSTEGTSKGGEDDRALMAAHQLLEWGVPIDAFCWVDPDARLKSLWEANPELRLIPCPETKGAGTDPWVDAHGNNTSPPDIIIDLSPQPSPQEARSIVRLEGEGLWLEQLLCCAAELWSVGVPVDRDKIHPARPIKCSPARPFLRERIWVPRAPEPTQRWVRHWRPVDVDSTAEEGGPSHVLSNELTGAQLVGEALRILGEREGPLTLVWESASDESSVTPGSDALALMAARSVLEVEDPNRRVRLWLGPEQALRTSPVDTEEVIWMRGGVPHAPRLESEPFAPNPRESFDGHWLVTGGRGALGTHVVTWLEERGARVTTIGRTPADAASGSAHHACVDVTQSEAFATWLEAHGPFDGAVHCAGVESRAWAHEMSDEALEKAFGVKVEGARCLDAHIEGPLILFGSATSWFGLPGQAAYAAANAWLEGLMDQRRQRGLPGTCVAWGPWTEGMATGLTREAGTGFMTPEVALEALSRSIDGAPISSIFRLTPSRFIERYHRVPAWLRAWAPDPREAAAPTSLSLTEATTLVARMASAVLNRPNPLDPDQGFADSGMDSIMAVELARRLSARLGEPLSLTAAFDHPRVDRLAAHIARSPIALDPPPSGAQLQPDAPIAIVGMALRFPGSSNADELWQSLVGQRIEIEQVPPTRWPTEGMEAATTYGGFLDGIDLFDPTPFGITPKEAQSMDPQQRLLLDVALEALERGGLDGDLDGSRTGTFLGIADRGYLRRFQNRGASRYVDAWAGTGNEPSFAAGRMAHALGLTGPAIALNTTCSSSLVAVDLARRALLDGTCDQAIAGGVHLMLTPDESSYLAQMGALSPSGRCHSFDARADGYVRSEACGIVVLKRLDDAIRDQDPVHAVIHASATNHDGRASGLTVPSGEAQRQVIASAWRQVEPEQGDLGLLEAHGTGTPLGDPIEYRAAQAALGNRCSGPVYVRSIKANLGHAELAAGIAGLISAVTCLEREAIPAMPNLTSPNPDLPGGPLMLAQETVAWPRGERPRLAGVSAFGLSGTNAHLVVGEAPSQALSPSFVQPSQRRRTRHWLEGDRFLSTAPVLKLSWAHQEAKPAYQGPLIIVSDDRDHPLGERMGVRVLRLDEALPWLSEQEGEVGLVLTAPEDAQAMERPVFEWMGLAQACAQRRDTHLWYLTRGGAATDEGEQLSPSGSLFSALARALLVEFPETAGGWCDTDSWQNLDRAALWEGCSTAIRDDGLKSAQLARSTAHETRDPLPETWVITGGLGALGLHTAQALANRGARALHLIGRTPLAQLPGTDKKAQVESIQQRGCRVSTHAADVTDPDAMRAIFTAIDADRIGLIHAAGVTEPTPSALADAELVQRVLAPKVRGARALDTCLEEAPVTHVVAFGSIAAVWGSRDLAPYAAANGFLAGWAHQLQARGLTARCVQWGPWSSGGMIGETEAYELGLYGLTPLNPAQASAALDEALRQSDPAPVAVEADWPTLSDHLCRTVSGDLFRKLAAEPSSTTGATVSPRAPHPVLDAAEATAIILREAEAILRPSTPLSTEIPLIEAGLDSLMATELRNTLGEHGLTVPLGRLLGGPSVEELVSIALAPYASSSHAKPEEEEDVPGWMWWTHLAALIVGAAIATGVAVLIQRLNG